MSVPLDRLYQYIESIAREVRQGNVIIYRFLPHGSKKIEDLSSINPTTTWYEWCTSPYIYCYDQEPLNYDLYENKEFTPAGTPVPYKNWLLAHGFKFKKLNIRGDRGDLCDVHDRCVLLHSEQRSRNVELYRSNSFIPAYYWSHAIIARDWFRYAQYEKPQKNVTKKFLIYNRAWSGTREYRLKFSDHLINQDLVDHCKTSVNPIEPELGIHYDQHHFINKHWRPENVIERYFPISQAHSHYSADFDMMDYNATDIEIVLETLFDDKRLHLTEKILRPIACGQPFILAATHGSLAYLREYGFRTFAHLWDESYDFVEDPQERLIRIVELMKQIASWSPEVRENKMALARSIAEHNRQHFFSQEFSNLVVNELKVNLGNALQELTDTNTCQEYFELRKSAAQIDSHVAIHQFYPEHESEFDEHVARTRQEMAAVVAYARQYYVRNQHKNK